ncbi:oligosaccharide flippase family protein [Salipiger bermudensis]|nr:oligosaccharide flippase family protein [Salipiger bermudensis]
MNQDLPEKSRKLGNGRARRGGMAIFAFVARSLQQIATFVITLLAARFLLPAEYGVYSLAIVFITLIQTLTYTGFYHFVVTSKQEDDVVLSTSFWMITGLATIAAGALALAAWPIAWAFDAPDLGPVLLLLAAVQPVAGAGAWFSAALLRRGAVNLHFTIMFVQNLAALVGGAVLLGLWQSLYALVAFRYLRVLTGAVLYLVLARDRPSRIFDREMARKATGFSGGLYGARFLNFLSRYAGDLLLGLMFSTAEAGLYRFGNRVAGGAVDVILQPMRSFALTQFGAAGRKGKDLAHPLERFTGTIVVLTGGVASVVVVFAPAVVADFFNPAYLAAIGVTYAMALRSVLSIGNLLLEPALAAKDRTGRVMMFNLVWTVLTILAVFVFSSFGLAALAWSQAAVMGMTTVSAFWLLRREGIRVGRAVRALGVSLGLVVLYAAALNELWLLLQAAIESDVLALCLGLGVATLLGCVALVLAWKLKVFTLGAFSG